MRVRRAVAAALLLSVVVAACGDDSSSPTTSAGAVETTTTAGGETTTTGAAISGDALSEDEATAALLTPDELNGNIEAGQWTDSVTPPPCAPDQPGVDQQLPPAYTVGAELVAVDVGAYLTEEIRAFADDSEAGVFFALGAASLDCPTATSQGVTMTISEPVDVTDEIGADIGTMWQVATDAGVDIVFVAAQVGPMVLSFSFVIPEEADTSSLDAPLDVAAAGVLKIYNA